MAVPDAIYAAVRIGDHENFDLLAEYPITEWNGGKVQFISENVIHLMRGQVFTLGERKLFTMGGASSHDIQDGILNVGDPDFHQKRKALDDRLGMYRTDHISWWKQELPSAEELAEGLKNLEKHHWKVDHIITHCAPTSLLCALSPYLEPDMLTDYLEQIRQKCEFKSWFFGHYHKDRDIWDKYTALYHEFRVFDAI